MKHRLMKRIAAPLLALLVLCAACGEASQPEPEAEPTTMRLTKAEGTVSVTDAEGTAVEVTEDLGLNSGCGLSTERASCAWFELDPAKQAKADESTQVQLRKEDGLLELDLKTGSLFFNITKPLAEGESVNILTSSMTAELRDACGWVTVDSESASTVYLLKGTISVSCSPDGPKHILVYAGQAAVVTVDGGDSMLVIDVFSADGVPEFVTAEVEQDSALAAEILADSGLDVLNPAPEPSEDPEPSPTPTLPEETGPVNLEEYVGTYFCEETGISVGFALSFTGKYLIITPHPGDYSHQDEYELEELEEESQVFQCLSTTTGNPIFTVTPRGGMILIESIGSDRNTAYLAGLYTMIT